MPYSFDGIGYNRESHTSWLAAKAIQGIRPTQKLKIQGLFETKIGVWRQGVLGISIWHVKTFIPEMFRDGESTAWSARLPDMVRSGEVCKLPTENGHEVWQDPTNTLRVLYFLKSDVEGLGPIRQLQLLEAA